MGRFVNEDYVSMTMEFRCNLKCVHCMIEGTMDRLVPESMQSFESLLEHNKGSGQWKGLVLTGSEITLRRDLPELARRARASGFEHVRIQTHGMHLADPDYCALLVAAGVDEYFVSVTAGDGPTHDAITAVPGAFDRMMRGLENLDAMPGVTLLTNTVVTRLSYRQLPAVVDRLGHLRHLAQMEFWSYWPMGEKDEKDLIVAHGEVLPFLSAAIVRARALGRAVEVKNFPACLLGDDRNLVVNAQPELIVDPAFWSEFTRNGFHQCVYRDRCASVECLGLNTAYIAKFGYEEDRLAPISPEGEMSAR
jgi:hypothetical protein